MSKNRAAIDLGTNSFRMLIAEMGGGPFTTVEKRLITVRLGENFKNSCLSLPAIQRGVEAINEFNNSLKNFPDVAITACGTAALRQAKNCEDFLQRAQTILQTKIAVLTPLQEAYLATMGTLSGLASPCKNILTVDVGGGSTELSYVEQFDPQENLTEAPPASQINIDDCSSISIPVGAVSLTETYLGPGPCSIEKIQHIKKTVNSSIKTKLKQWHKVLYKKNLLLSPEFNPSLIASGGTATALACLDLELTDYDENKVQGHLLTKKKLDSLFKKLIDLPPVHANSLPGLDNRRGEIIIAGLIVLDSIMDYWSAQSVTISDSGLLEGILLAG